MKKVGGLRNRKSERGQTIALVAVAITALLAMAALAIDVVSLYVARAETQRAADAAALAGAKMFVSSGLTSLPTSGGPISASDVCTTGGTAAANKLAAAVTSQNLIAGQPATVDSVTCTVGEQRNPQITVTVRSGSLPGFFSRIWNRPGSIARATATAEAYNSAGMSPPVSVGGVKPWLLPNCYTPSSANWGTAGDCASGLPKFINSDGTVNNSTPSFAGELMELTRIDCTGGAGPGCGARPNTGSFYSMDIPINPPSPVCPSGDVPSCDYNPDVHNYSDNIACANPYGIQCGQTIAGGGSAVTLFATGTTGGGRRGRGGYASQTTHATRCLIHADDDGTEQGQDGFTNGSAPVMIRGTGVDIDNYNNPNQDLQDVSNLSRSDSVVTVPLYDGMNPLCDTVGNCGTAATVVGFLQLGITCTVPGGGTGCQASPAAGTPQVEAVILNVVGCAPGASGTPVTGTGTSPVAVRLIH